MSDKQNTYWNGNGKYHALGNKLREMIPDEGQVPNPRKNRKLEKFRKAVNCYYDLYNNGLINRASQFSKVFGISARQYRYTGSWRYMDCLYDETEKAMDQILIEAAIEQGLVSDR